MDLLKKELARKKKALKEAKEAAVAESGGNRTFLKAGELRRLQEEQEEAATTAATLPKRKRDNEEDDNSNPRKKYVQDNADGENEEEGKLSPQHEDSKSSPNAATTGDGTRPLSDDLNQLSSIEITQKLRQMGLPVRLFGESCSETSNNNDDARRDRLRKALEELSKSLASLSERDEFRLETGQSIRNRFLEKDDAVDTMTAAAAASLPEESTAKRTKEEEDDDEAKKKKKDEDLSKDPHKKIYKYFKGLLRSWEDDLVRRPINVKQSIAGKNETKTMQQCKDYIKPLFKLCKSRSLEEGLLMNLIKIVDFCQEGEFVQAHDTYLDVAIGRAAWPIGVTMVGIHARKGRAKIESQNVAHVMNSELQRKYLTSIKRLMTYAQSKRTDVDPSKKVMN